MVRHVRALLLRANLWACVHDASPSHIVAAIHFSSNMRKTKIRIIGAYTVINKFYAYSF